MTFLLLSEVLSVQKATECSRVKNMKDIKNIFRGLEKLLKEAKWFDEDWEIYNRGPYLQLYKTTWFNHNQGGIHFETSIEAPQLKDKVFPIAMHAEEDCPSQAEFKDCFLRLEGERIKSWKNYQIDGGGFTVLQRKLPLNYKNLEQRIYSELSLLRQLEDGIESTLNEL